MHMLAPWVALPENLSARVAVDRVAECVSSRRPRRSFNPLYLYGPAGTGKTHLVTDLVHQVTRKVPDSLTTVLPAHAFATLPETGTEGPVPDAEVDLTSARQADLVVLEDLQHLPARAAETVVQLLDRCLTREQQLVLTASVGPAQLTRLPARLTSRLAGALVVELQVLGPASRLAYLRARAEGRRPAVEPSLLAWVAENVPGSARQLDGALGRLEALTRLHDHLPTPGEVAEHFRTEAEARRPTVERIAQRVSHYFRVEPRQLQSRRRTRNALLPRQVGMYLARQLTPLSLEQIGAYFGGRDHTTVLHACRKVEQALARDHTLSGAVRQLHADLA